MIITIIKAILFVLSSGILFREFISTNHSRKEVKISGIVIVFATVFLFIIDAIPVGSSVDNSSKASSAVNNKPVTPSKQEKQSFEPKMTVIKGGCFQIGSPESEIDRDSYESQHEVCVDDFELGIYEVTQEQWQAVMGDNPAGFKGNNLPIENITLFRVMDFIDKLNEITKNKYRLPTQAEWEYAARAGTTTPFYTGHCIFSNQANYNGKTDYANCGSTASIRNYNQTVAVGSYQPNKWGLYDMIGNVSEWTCSIFHSDYGYNKPEKECTDIENHTYITRGGSFSDTIEIQRSAKRSMRNATDYSADLGFRLAKDKKNKFILF